MFSSTEYQFINDLVLTELNNDYVYYICNTDTYINTYNTNDYDLTCYFSKGVITENNLYNFTFSDNYIRYKLDSNSYSSSNSLQKLVRDNFNANTISINNYEYIYTNAENSNNADLLSIIKYDKINNVSYNLDLNDFCLFGVLLVIPILFAFLKNMLCVKGSDLK